MSVVLKIPYGKSGFCWCWCWWQFQCWGLNDIDWTQFCCAVHYEREWNERDKPKLEVCRGSLENYQIGITHPLPSNKKAFQKDFNSKNGFLAEKNLTRKLQKQSKNSRRSYLIRSQPCKSQIFTTLFPLKPCDTKTEMLSQISTSLPTVGLNWKINFSGQFFLYSYWCVSNR